MKTMRDIITMLESTLNELTLAPPRQIDHVGDGEPPPRPPRPKERGEEPKEGLFWMRGTAMIPITGKCNSIVFLSGQRVILDPAEYGLSVDAIRDYLSKHGSDQYSASNEYERYLQDPTQDLSHNALLWKSSKLVYKMMLENGWMWVNYRPPELIRFAVIPHYSKMAVKTASQFFPLMQIDRIEITLIQDFHHLLDIYPHMSDNRTLTFSNKDHKGFAGSFGATMHWASTGEAPASNWLYVASYQSPHELMRSYGFQSRRASVAVEPGVYRKRAAVACEVAPEANLADGKNQYRFGSSIAKQIGMSMSTFDRGRRAYVWGDRHFGIRPDKIEALVAGQWVSLAQAASGPDPLYGS